MQDRGEPWLDDKHSILDEVVEGMDVVKTLEANGSQTGRPKQELKIVRATIGWERAAGAAPLTAPLRSQAY